VAVRPDANTDDDKGAKREGLLADLRKLKRDREIVLGERSKSDQELTQLNANIQKMVSYSVPFRACPGPARACFSRVRGRT
jgi:hypothetical protein